MDSCGDGQKRPSERLSFVFNVPICERSACTTSTSDVHSPSHMPPTIMISSPNKFAVWPVRRGGAEAAFRKEVTEQVTMWINVVRRQ